jgi:hypothetical protein
VASLSPTSGVASRYAQSLFDIALETKSVDKVEKQLADFEALLERGRLMDIRAAEISAILKDQIKNFGRKPKSPKSARCCPSATVSPASTAWTTSGRRDGRVPGRHQGHGAEPRKPTMSAS